jgi:hypothetical protein
MVGWPGRAAATLGFRVSQALQSNLEAKRTAMPCAGDEKRMLLHAWRPGDEERPQVETC